MEIVKRLGAMIVSACGEGGKVLMRSASEDENVDGVVVRVLILRLRIYRLRRSRRLVITRRLRMRPRKIIRDRVRIVWSSNYLLRLR